jgi:ribosomal protein S7
MINNDKNNDNNFINLNQKEKNIYTIGPKDLVVTITSNKKKIKRVNPNAYLNESYEYLSHNIFMLSKDQAGCRYLQKKLEKEPEIATNYFYEAMQPYLAQVMKDPFGNYLIQKIIKNLDEKRIKKILEAISSSIVEIGINNHGTRVIQFLITFLTTKELQDYFVEIIKPHTIQLLKELNGAHIIQKILLEYPESCSDINKIIIDNCSYLAAHRHGCCVLQKFIDGNYKKLEGNLITNLINNCLVLITDQFGNYVIQSILSLKNDKVNSEVAKKIIDNLSYYSKHRYSSNVVEKCFDLCNEQDKKSFVEKLCSPEIVAELILDDHGNYVIQKVLQCADEKTKENMLKNIIPLIPKIKELSFGEKLLNRLFCSYPQLNSNSGEINNNNLKKKINHGYHKENKEANNEQEKNYKNRKNKK